jgi:hypothetical protein
VWQDEVELLPQAEKELALFLLSFSRGVSRRASIESRDRDGSDRELRQGQSQEGGGNLYLYLFPCLCPVGLALELRLPLCGLCVTTIKTTLSQCAAWSFPRRPFVSTKDCQQEFVLY